MSRRVGRVLPRALVRGAVTAAAQGSGQPSCSPCSPEPGAVLGEVVGRLGAQPLPPAELLGGLWVPGGAPLRRERPVCGPGPWRAASELSGDFRLEARLVVVMPGLSGRVVMCPSS